MTPADPPAEPTRRHFLASAAATAAGFAALGCYATRRPASAAVLDTPPGLGPLLRDPADVLDLPAGFSYRVVSRAGGEMDDGLLVPGRPDGMAAFPAPSDAAGRFCVLVRNHELDPGSFKQSPFGRDGRRLRELPRDQRDRLYDAGYGYTPGLGGTTTLLVDLDDPARPVVAREFLSLGGTVRNCAGGPTPWGTWISCEETVLGVGPNTERSHGFNFEVPSDPAGGLAEPRPIGAMGRFCHEAVCVDPETGVVYQTEDVGDGGIYRYLPEVPGDLHAGGRLQSLAVDGRPSLDLRNWDRRRARVGEAMPVAWVDCEDVLNPDDDLRHRCFAAGAARFARGEGMWFGDAGAGDGPAVFFACTNGGRRKKGQIWRHDPRGGTLTLFAEPDDGNVIDNADNLTVNPHGGLIVCEDGGGEQFLRGLTPAGRVWTLARNSRGDSEFAGACFDPSGRVLFVNIQHRGLTLAVTGPWDRAAG